MERETEFIKLWQDYTDEETDDVVIANNKLMKYLETGGFFTAPASTKYHGAYEGGLYDHSKQVFLRLKRLTEDNDLEWERPESPFIIGMFHDLCKCDQYIKKDGTQTKIGDNMIYTAEGYHYEYNSSTLLKGHGSKSVMLLSQFINLTEEEMLCIRYHMGAYETDEWDEFGKAITKYPNVLWTHMADMLASKVDDV
mgnify:CR=1 FL=1